MPKFSFPALLMGLLLVSSAPFTSTSAANDGDVVVLTTKNFDEIVLRSKFALVRLLRRLSQCPPHSLLTLESYGRRSSFMHLGTITAR